MRALYPFVLALATLLVFSCKGDESNFIVSGTFPGNPPPAVYLYELTSQGSTVIDSVFLKESPSFKLKGYTAMPAFFMLSIDKRRGIHLVAAPGDKIKVHILSPSIETDYTVDGSVESRRISQLVREQSRVLEQITLLSEEFEEIKEDKEFLARKQVIDEQYYQLVDDHKAFSERYILENPGSFAALMALYQQLGRRAPVFDLRTDFALFNLVDSSLSALYPSSDAVKTLNRKVVDFGERHSFRPGAKAPHFALPDTAGRMTTLGEVMPRLLLLSFSASWCDNCLEELPQIKEAYIRYKNQGFDVLEVSLDRTHESWGGYLVQNNISWTCVNDLKYWDNEAARLYQVKKVPYYVLISSDGQIVTTGQNFTELYHAITENI